MIEYEFDDAGRKITAILREAKRDTIDSLTARVTRLVRKRVHAGSKETDICMREVISRLVEHAYDEVDSSLKLESFGYLEAKGVAKCSPGDYAAGKYDLFLGMELARHRAISKYARFTTFVTRQLELYLQHIFSSLIKVYDVERERWHEVSETTDYLCKQTKKRGDYAEYRREMQQLVAERLSSPTATPMTEGGVREIVDVHTLSLESWKHTRKLREQEDLGQDARTSSSSSAANLTAEDKRDQFPAAPWEEEAHDSCGGTVKEPLDGIRWEIARKDEETPRVGADHDDTHSFSVDLGIAFDDGALEHAEGVLAVNDDGVILTVGDKSVSVTRGLVEECAEAMDNYLSKKAGGSVSSKEQVGADPNCSITSAPDAVTVKDHPQGWEMEELHRNEAIRKMVKDFEDALCIVSKWAMGK